MEKMTDVELQIMDCIWSIGTDVSPSQVLTLLNKRFHRGWTLQTLSTYMLRMAGKGFLKRMTAALIKENELSAEEIQDLRDYLDELDLMEH